MMPRDIGLSNSVSSDLLDHAVARHHDDVLVRARSPAPAGTPVIASSGCRLIRFDDVLALARGARVGNFVNLQPVHAARCW